MVSATFKVWFSAQREPDDAGLVQSGLHILGFQKPAKHNPHHTSDYLWVVIGTGHPSDGERDQLLIMQVFFYQVLHPTDVQPGSLYSVSRTFSYVQFIQ